jgi:hypothetical protein
MVVSKSRQVGALKEFPRLFTNDFGAIVHHHAELRAKVDVVSKFFRTRNIYFALREKVTRKSRGDTNWRFKTSSPR